MKPVLFCAAVSVACLILLGAAPKEQSGDSIAQYDAKGNLLRPADYRDWEFLSAGFGMNYNAAAGSHDMFTNVFVQKWAYEEFLGSGKWPQKTMFVIDERGADSKASINKHGHYQTDLMGLAVEVKDSAHNPDTWSYYGFEPDGKTAEAMPKGNPCYSCHEAHGAVEHTFVQFYPTLKPVAQKFGTYNEAREQVSDDK
jgi:hypothetical protein